MSSGRPKATERAVDLAFALTFLIVAAGAVLIMVSFFVAVRASVPALGLILFIVGLVLMFEFGVRPALRQERDPVLALKAGLGRLFGWMGRMVGGS